MVNFSNLITFSTFNAVEQCWFVTRTESGL